MNAAKKTVAALLVTFFVSISVAAGSETLTGREIMERNEEQNKGEDEFNETSMKLVNKRGQERNRKRARMTTTKFSSASSSPPT
jgi:hypothetical protein